MDKSAIQAYTEWAKVELTNAVKQKAFEYGITETSISEADDVVNGRVLNRTEQKQRRQLVSEIKEKGYKNVIEEVTYTWFNRFIALRFMEVNGYLPSHTRVFSDDENKFNPQILKEALTVEIDGLDREIIVDYLDKNNSEGLFKYLVISQCNALNKIIPVLFEKIANYTELLFPNNLLKKDSVLDKLVNDIPEEDWKDQVQILGWLYQFYVAMDREDFRKVKVVKKEHIPTLSQIFTPDWIVRYMAENSVGRLWLESYPNSSLKKEMQYYVEDAPQTEEVSKQLQEIKYKDVNPENIHVIEPCCGSGHILVYVFDLLAKMYEEKGYKKSDIPTLILRNNLVGLDIDRRASQLAYFSLMMKARSLDNRLFSRDELTHPMIFEIVDSESIFDDDYESIMESHHFSRESINTAKYLAETFRHAKVIGSLLLVNKKDYHSFISELKEKKNTENWNIFETHFETSSINLFIRLARLAIVMSNKYDVMITNPPYLESGSLEPICKTYTVKHYPNSKTDMFAMFMETPFVRKNGFRAIVNPTSWMFLPAYKDLRKKILFESFFASFRYLGKDQFDAGVQTTTFVIRNARINFNSTFVDKNLNSFRRSNNFFDYFPSKQIAFWLSERAALIYQNSPVGNVADFKQGMRTGNNEKFIRLWHEVSFNNIGIGMSSRNDSINSNKKWFPIVNGGSFRKWYGNFTDVINWKNDGYEIRNYFVDGRLASRPQNLDYFFKDGLSWSSFTSDMSVRDMPKGFIISGAGFGIYSKSASKYFLMGLLNSDVCSKLISALSDTLNFDVGIVASIPLVECEGVEIDSKVKQCVEISKQLWDSSETSWDYKKTPLEIREGLLSDICHEYTSSLNKQYDNLLNLEKNINDDFYHLYGLEAENMPQENEREQVSINRVIIELISYFVGCLFGRYSLDKEGLIFAGGKINFALYNKFSIDNDNIIPICDDEYFDDDILGRFVNFISIVFGKKYLEENLKFISSCLGGTGTPRQIIRKYFVSDFYTNHLKMYQKRPIYWLFDSGKKNGFKALVYMHRYSPDLLAKMRTDYVHEQQERYRTQIANLESEVLHLDGMEKSKANKRLSKLKEQLLEINEYEEKIHHLADQMIEIDLDDGVKVNYAKFQDVLAPIK